ncbi:proline dehydrogenase [Pontibacillus chungwhensis BH030062]|uniref:proline dehydrogenase n=1 Tax=Pontibacillus chungwhensis BH030062 TaxID=1385513 RepID=A0A0A2UYJ5_9BACI|nr:proline dehydrogenase family protein [Pontibacillus chungwhensis]KGP91606.1 proline dehydrogenase [Pontibacillus chungwhensis BH030062]
MEALSKNFFLLLSNSSVLDKMAKKWGPRLGADKIVGGESFDQAIPLIQQLNSQGLHVTVDHLGEYVNSEAEARERAEECISTIQAIHNHQLNTQLSLKLTSLGLDISRELVYENMTRILDAAKQYDVVVTIDMEDSSRTEKTLELYKYFKKDYDNLGTVIQSYLFRSNQDVEELSDYNAYLRLVKGAYKESGKVAFTEKSMVDDNLKKLIAKHLLNGNYTAIASHDEAMIEFTKDFVEKNNIPKDQFEFQMLYGMRNQMQLDLLQEGYKVRVYLPYGEDWYGYFMRRLAERPANIAFAVKGLFSK